MDRQSFPSLPCPALASHEDLRISNRTKNETSVACVCSCSRRWSSLGALRSTRTRFDAVPQKRTNLATELAPILVSFALLDLCQILERLVQSSSAVRERVLREGLATTMLLLGGQHTNIHMHPRIGNSYTLQNSWLTGATESTTLSHCAGSGTSPNAKCSRRHEIMCQPIDAASLTS